MTSGKIRMGLVGGGPNAFIGAVHRSAAALDGQIELVCGAFSRDPAASRAFGESLHLPAHRAYADFDTMFSTEAALPADERMQFVAIVTPNHLHFDIAKQAFEHGFHVFSEKPATISVEQAHQLAAIQAARGLLYGLAHTYTGYPMIKEARALVQSGGLGRIVKIVVEYTQGWLASADDETSKQAAWRIDPDQSGASLCMGDIGVHAANLAEFVSGCQIEAMCADIASVVPGRTLDDDGSVLLKFDNGARGVLLASQIHIGDENNLRLRVIGDYRSLEWSQLEPNTLWVKSADGATQMRRAGVGTMHPTTEAAMRIPAGHPEGYLEAFANLYRSFAAQIRAAENDETSPAWADDLPGMPEAIRGMAFIENVIAAGASEQKWFAHHIPTIDGGAE